jgi:hypothetical protein
MGISWISPQDQNPWYIKFSLCSGAVGLQQGWLWAGVLELKLSKKKKIPLSNYSYYSITIILIVEFFFIYNFIGGFVFGTL